MLRNSITARYSAYRARYPERGADLETAAALAPFARLMAGRGGELPFSYWDAEDHARAAFELLGVSHRLGVA